MVVVVIGGTYGSDPAVWDFHCNWVGFIGLGFWVWPSTTNCPSVLHTVFLSPCNLLSLFLFPLYLYYHLCSTSL